MKNITLRFGLEHVICTVPDSTTNLQLTQDDETKMKLGYGDNISLAIDGIEIPGGAVPPNGATVVITNACNTKANAPSV